jgi:hypothetical protein
MKNIIIKISVLLSLTLITGCSPETAPKDVNKEMAQAKFQNQLEVYSIYYCPDQKKYQLSIGTMKLGDYDTLLAAKIAKTNEVIKVNKDEQNEDKDLQVWVNSQPKVCGKKIE